MSHQGARSTRSRTAHRSGPRSDRRATSVGPADVEAGCGPGCSRESSPTWRRVSGARRAPHCWPTSPSTSGMRRGRRWLPWGRWSATPTLHADKTRIVYISAVARTASTSGLPPSEDTVEVGRSPQRRVPPDTTAQPSGMRRATRTRRSGVSGGRDDHRRARGPAQRFVVAIGRPDGSSERSTSATMAV